MHSPVLIFHNLIVLSPDPLARSPSPSKLVDSYKLNNDFVKFSPHAIQKALEKLKTNSSPGADQIHNLLLKKLPFEYTKKILFCLVNIN